MLMYDLIEYSDNYQKISASSWQHYRNEPTINSNGVVMDFTDDTDIASFKHKQKIVSHD